VADQPFKEMTMTTSTPPSYAMELRRAAIDALPGYVAALKTGWSPDNIRPEVAAEQLAMIDQDADAFIASLDDPQGRGPHVMLPDGSTVPRLPSVRRWIFDDEFCGSIGLRWQRGTEELPPHVLGHIGYAIVPWKRGRGYATRALALLLPEAWSLGLGYVELTTDPDNIPSQKVILANGGKLIGPFREHEAYGAKESLRWRINGP
jgi:predicted acetyltransferase